MGHVQVNLTHSGCLVITAPQTRQPSPLSPACLRPSQVLVDTATWAQKVRPGQAMLLGGGEAKQGSWTAGHRALNKEKTLKNKVKQKQERML